MAENGKPATNGTQNGDSVGAPPSQVPDWIQVGLFENVLKEVVPDFKKVKNFTTKSALAPGENYATIMLRVEIDIELEDGKSKPISFMLKVGHENDAYKALVEKHNMFDVERGMYFDIVPEMEEMYRTAGVDLKFQAQSYKLNTNKNYVLLEDLKWRGFKNADRLKGLDIEHTKCVLVKLAQWHAASATRVANKGHYPDIYKHGFFDESQREMFDQIQQSIGGVALECMKTYEGYELYSDEVTKLQTNITDKLFQVGKIDTNEFNVLNHGDCWVNNIMFQYDAFGKIKETYLVDYQIPKYGTPAQDLYYFLLSSTQYEIKLKQFDYFIKFYYDNLIENLKLLKYPKKLPTLREIHIQLYKNGIWGYSTATGVMAAVLLDPNENASLDNFLNESDAGLAFKRLMYTNARYRKHVEAIMPWLYYRGALEN